MNKMIKKVTSLLVFMAMLMSFTFVCAEESELITRVSCVNGVITLWGKTGNASVFLLNPGKTVSDFENVQSDKFNEVVNYFCTVKGDNNKNYTCTFKINNYDSEASYLLYVNDGINSETKQISTGETMKIYVSASADASVADGTIEHPYNSIEAAKNAIRSSVLSDSVEVIISGGTYYIDDTIEFTSADSGMDGMKITYKAAEGEKVKLSGAKRVTNSNIKKVTDIGILSRVSNEAAENLVEIDLEKENIPKEIVDFTKELKPDYHAKPMGFFVNGKRQTLSKWPNEGYKTILEGSTMGGTSRNNTESEGGAIVKIEDFDTARAKKWVNAKNMYAEGYMMYAWHGQSAKIGSVNPDEATINFATYTKYGVSAGNRITIVNLLEEIDIPGEWYADIDTMKLYYYAPKPITADDVLEIGVLDNNIISIENAKNIWFENIEFENNAPDSSVTEGGDNGGNGILVKNSENIVIKNCDFREIGDDAIRISYSKNITVTGCDIYSAGLSGIADYYCGDKDTLTASGNVFFDNFISACTRNIKSAGCGGINLVSGVGTIVRNNTLNRHGMAAVFYDGNLYEIKNNEVYNNVYESYDFSSMYSGRSFSKYGTVMKNNYFHDLGDYGTTYATGYHVHAASWDDNGSGNSFIGNIVDMGSRSNTAGFQIAAGRDNVVSGNIFVNATYPIYTEDRTATDYTDKTSQIYQSFAYAAKQGEDVKNLNDDSWLPAFKEQFPQIMENYAEINAGTYNRKNTITNNVYYNCTNGWRISELTEDVSTIKNNRSLYIKTSFVDASNKDYRITNTVKNLYNLGNDIPTSDFSMDSIGVSENTMNSEYADFDLLYPNNNSNISINGTVISWEDSAFADNYTYQISSDSGFKTIVTSGTTRETFAEISGLSTGKTYYWRVYGNNLSRLLDETSICSEVYSFTTNGEVRIKDVSYSQGDEKVQYTMANEGSSAESVTVFLALKDSEGKLLDVKMKPYTIDSGKEISDYIINDFSNITNGDVLEVYFWDMTKNMKNYSYKYTKNM